MPTPEIGLTNVVEFTNHGPLQSEPNISTTENESPNYSGVLARNREPRKRKEEGSYIKKQNGCTRINSICTIKGEEEFSNAVVH